MKSWSFFLRLIGFVLLIPLFILTLGGQGFSKKAPPGHPKVEMTIFLVPEREACKPSGYRTLEDETTNCQPLALDDIEKWKKLGVISQTIKIPPGEISLNNLIFGILDLYERDRKKTPDQRLAAVFLFKWETPQKSAVSLERIVGPKYANIPAGNWSGLLNNETFWIHQERADALLPAYNINWILKVENNIWKFHFVRK